MTTLLPRQPQPEQDAAVHPVAAPLAPTPLPDLTTLSTLWMPLHETRQVWAAFGAEALTASALMATSTAFSGLFWEARALQHYIWASDVRGRARWHTVVCWLGRAVQDLDCALDQWQQVLSWLDLAGNDHHQPDPQSLDPIQMLIGQTHEHQARRRALHQQVLGEYIEAKGHKQHQQRHRHASQTTGVSTPPELEQEEVP